MSSLSRALSVGAFALLLHLKLVSGSVQGQTLLNIDFGAGPVSGKSGFAGTGQSTNDFWNRYRHYEPKFLPGMALVPNGRLENLRFADESVSHVVLALTNAPGVWGNATGDPMFDSYVFAPNGSNIVMTLTGLEPGRYHFYLYGHADADVSAEQNSLFTLSSGTNRFGPFAPTGSSGWQAGHPWREGVQFVVVRDVPVTAEQPVLIEVAPGSGGIAVLNGLQILSRGTAPPRLTRAEPTTPAQTLTNLLFREVRYEGLIGSNDVRLSVKLHAESRSTNELDAVLFKGEVALLNPKLPDGWRVVPQGKELHLLATAPGEHDLEFELVPKVAHADPYDQILFVGPPAAIATVDVSASMPEIDLQLQSGTAVPQPDKSKVRGVLGADQQLALRWQNRRAEVARETLFTVTTRVSGHVAPASIRYVSTFQCEVLQGRLSQLRFRIPADQTLTRLEGEAVRDWQLALTNGQSVLEVQFIRPIDTHTTLMVTTEQAVSALPRSLELAFPAPLEGQRETGALALSSEDVTVRIDSTTGLRQVNAPEDQVAAFQFSGRPARLQAQLSRIEPLITSASRVRAWLEESRFVVKHDLDLNVERAGIYALTLQPDPGFTVTEVTGDGVDDWKVADGKVQISYGQRVLGARRVRLTLEQALTNTPPELMLRPVQVAGASKQRALIGAGSTAGLQLKTSRVSQARELPATALPDRADELLAYQADGADWQIVLAAERLAPRLVGEVFNLLTVGDGLVGGSATVRLAIFNQGVQQFRVRLPKTWRNVEFTGANLRRKDQQDDVWTISLQEKAWGGYTLVITYDFPFDPKKATLDAAGAHPLDVERESGTVAITTAAALAIDPEPVQEPLRSIDPTQLPETDRALITRPVLLAYRYEGSTFALRLNTTRHDELPVLDAVADRAQLTSVLTETGEMLTQATFMVKNSERQFQRFRLPAGATLWAVAVNGEPIKADQDKDWLLVSLPRELNRDQAFAVDIKYAQHFPGLGGIVPRRAELVAPRTDVPGTYAQWELFVPASKRVGRFSGNMSVARGTTYTFRDGWEEFLRIYKGLWHEYGQSALVGGVLAAFLLSLVLWGRRRGFQGVVGVLGVFCILAILSGMLLPALSRAKSKAQQIKSINNLKQIGLAARIYAGDNGGKLPSDFDQMRTELSTDKVLFDPETGERYSYAGNGKSETDPNAILAYSAEKNGRREVVLADGTVQQVSAPRFAELLQKQGTSAAARPELPVKDNPTTVELGKRYALKPAEGMPTLAPESALTLSPRPVVGQILAAQPGAVTASAGGTPTRTGTAPTAAGIRSLRIDLPHSGRAVQFTRVLNLSGEPATIGLSVMSARAFTAGQMLFQLGAFLAGLALVYYQWNKRPSRALWLAAGLALVLISTTSLFVAWRALGLALSLAVPTALLIVIAWIISRAWHRQGPAGNSSPGVTAPPIHPTAPAALVVFLAAFSASQALGETPLPAASIVSAHYTGSVDDRVARLDATLELVSNSTNAIVNLFGEEVAIQEFRVSNGDARLLRDGKRVSLFVPARGQATLQLKLLLKVGGESGRHQLDFAIPAALGSHLSLVLSEPDAEIDFPTAISWRRSAQHGHTQLEAVLAATDRVTLSWTPKVKRASEVAATAFVQQSALVAVGEGVLTTRSVLEYQVTQGELRQVLLLIPEGHRLLRVTGATVRSWELAETNHTELVVDLLKTVGRSTRLVIETEAALSPLPATVPVTLPQPIGVQHVTGQIGIRPSDELSLEPAQSDGLDRIESAEFKRSYGDDKLALLSAWRFVRPDFKLAMRAGQLLPKLEVDVRHQARVMLDQLTLRSHLDYVVTRAGLFTVSLVIPAELHVDAVTCSAMKTWTERTENGARRLEVALKQRTLGALSMDILLSRPLTNSPPVIELAAPHPLGVDKLRGVISLSSEPGVSLKTASLSGLTEIPAASLPAEQTPAATADPSSSSGLLAFKFQAGANQESASWKLSLAIDAIDSWVRVEAVHFVTVSETLVSGRTILRYDIQNAPTKEFRFKAPATWQNVDVSGTGIRRRDHTNEQWRVELQNRVRGEYRLVVHWEQSRPAGTNDVALAGLEAQGVERETGAVAIYAQAPLQVMPRQSSDDLLRIDARELPAWALDREVSPNSATAVLSYRFVRPGWRMLLQVERFSDASLLQALVESARLRTVLADDGQAITQMELSLRNNGRQSLAVHLPAGAKVWAASVAGQPVRPAQRGDELLLPLGASGSDAPVTVELTYVNAERFPKHHGKLELSSPRLDVPWKDAHWELFLPPDYDYRTFGGSMTYERADLAPVAQDFTFAEYRRQENEQQAAAESQAVQVIRRARGEIASGKYRDAGSINFFSNSRMLQNESAARELKQLEEDVNRSQTSNLLRGQQALNSANFDRYGVQTGMGAPANLPQQVQAGVYDAKVAEQQARQLQKAQVVAASVVSPIHITLPTRGLRHSFVQILQTEMEKPLTITLSAANERQVGWFKILVLTLAGFGALWVAAGLALSLRPGDSRTALP